LTAPAVALRKVTVGLPVFNAEKYLLQAIRSLLGQTFRDFELLISDNASTDDTQKICTEYAARDSRVRYVRNPENIGATANFVSVLKLANTPYFMWAAYDDLWSPNLLDNAVSALDANPECGFALTDVVLKSINYRVWRTVPSSRFAFVEDESPERRVLEFVNRHIYSHKTNMVYSLMRTEVLKRAVEMAGFLDADLLCAAILWHAPAKRVPGPKFYKRYPKKWPAMFVNRSPGPEKVAAFEAARDERFDRMGRIFPGLQHELELIRRNYRPRNYGRDFLIVDDPAL
jgi:glycosyltransferase involved in cell wall biosynthesis